MLVSSMGMRFFFKVLLAKGLSLQEIEQSTGIIRAELDNPRYRVPMSHLNKLAEMSFKATGNPALGLHLINSADASILNHTTVLFMNCDNLKEVFKYWLRYAKLLAEGNEIELREAEHCTLSYTNTSHYQADWIPEFNLINAVMFCRKWIFKDFKPLEVHFQHAAPSYAREYEKAFKVPVIFEQEQNALVISKKDLNRPIPQANPIIKKMLIEQSDALLSEQTQKKTYDERVRVIIKKNISTRNLDICAVASELRMHRTTLYRKLSQEGTSFTALLEEVRQSLALIYINQNISNHHIANRLGYSEPSAFQNAFKRWFGRSPGEYRLYSD